MHDSCQRVVIPLNFSTVLIIRGLPRQSNEKLYRLSRINFPSTHFETGTYTKITSGQSPSVMYYLITPAIKPFVKNFSYRLLSLPESTQNSCLASGFDSLVTPYITSLRLRRNAGTSRSSCSKFGTIAPRMASSEITSPAKRSEACAIGRG